jgi:hypothetical protein
MRDDECGECRAVPSSWICPNCGFRVCTSCKLMYGGYCQGCNPKFEQIKESGRKNE